MSESQSNSDQLSDLMSSDVEKGVVSAQTIPNNSNKNTSTTSPSVSADSSKTTSSNGVKPKKSKKTSDPKEPLVNKAELPTHNTKSIRTNRRFSDDLDELCSECLHQVNWFYNQSVRFILRCFGCLLNSAEYRNAIKEWRRTGDWSKCRELEEKAGLWLVPKPAVLVAITKGWSLTRAQREIDSTRISSSVNLEFLDTSCMRSIFD